MSAATRTLSACSATVPRGTPGSPRSLFASVEPSGPPPVLTANGVGRLKHLRHQMTMSAADAAGELQLLERTARGDRDAFQRLYFIFHRRLTRFLLRVTRRPDVTEEIINDTMLVVWQRA